MSYRQPLLRALGFDEGKSRPERADAIAAPGFSGARVAESRDRRATGLASGRVQGRSAPFRPTQRCRASGRYSSLFDTGELEILEGEAEQQGETGEVFDEADVEELASRLLDVGNEAEFDRLLGGMISHAAQQVGGELSAP